MAAKVPILKSFENIAPGLLKQNGAVARQVSDSRIKVISGEIDAVARPFIDRMIKIFEDEKKLVEGLSAKWVGKKIKRYHSKDEITSSYIPNIDVNVSSQSKSLNYTETQKHIAAAYSYIHSGRMPLFASSKAVQWQEELTKVNAALEIAALFLQNEKKSLLAAIAGFGNSPGIRADKKAAEKYSAGLNIPGKYSASVGEGIPSALPPVTEGHARLLFQCGWSAHSAQLKTACNTNTQSYGWAPNSNQLNTSFRLTNMNIQPLFIPCLVDLMLDHGFMTSHADTVKSFVLRILNTLPGGSLKFHVYDPQALGDSVKYLYPLGDKQKDILGENGVLSSNNQLRELLEETERHIGIINQRYLAGKYKNLIEYNQDAGVTSEPYRILLIYDDPAQWAKNYQGELTDQLKRIIDAGSKCGVFVVIQSNNDTDDFGLPILRPFRPSVLPAIATKYAHAGKNVVEPGIMEIIQSKNIRNAFDLEDIVTWVPAPASMFSSSGEKAIVNKLEKSLQNFGIVSVDPATVEAIAETYRSAQKAKGVIIGPPVLAYNNSSSWWRESSANGIYAYVGIDKANQKKPRLVSFKGTPEEFGALVGGQSRSGKSTFLHALISELIRRYSPKELQLYLIDVKFGAEFKKYASAMLPHAKVVALESGAEFALSVLRSLVQNMSKRYEAFKKAGVSKIDDFRLTTKIVMPRVLAIFDEFSGIFETDNAVSEEATNLLTRLIQQGSASGIHLILSSQSLSTAAALPRNVLPQIPQRIVFKLPDQDSRMFLADDNPAGSLLNRAGEGLFNPSNGRKGANEGFQGTNMTPGDLAITLKLLSDLSKTKKDLNKPVVLESVGSAPWNQDGINLAQKSVSGLKINVPVGLPLSLDKPVCALMEQTVGGNMLVCIHDEQTYINIVASIILGCLLGGAAVRVFDFTGKSGAFSMSFSRYMPFLTSKKKDKILIFRDKELYNKIEQYKNNIDKAMAGNKAPPYPVVLVAVGVSQALNLNQLSQDADNFKELLEKGAAFGVHIVAACDSLGIVKSKFGYQWSDSFSTVITGRCGSSDSLELTQCNLARDLDNDEQVVLYDRLTGQTQKVRPYHLSSFPFK